MKKYTVTVNACDFGQIAAETAKDARDKAAQMAGYKCESDMEEQLGQASEIVVEELE